MICQVIIRFARRVMPTSLRGKFIVAPMIALVTMAVISVLLLYKLTEQRHLLEHLEQDELVVIGQLAGVSSRISHIHSRVYAILDAARAGADEEAVYESSRPLIEHLVGIEQLLTERLLKAAHRHDGENIYAPIEAGYLRYKSTIVSAIEMSTVDTVMAEEQLLAADKIYSLLVIDLQEGLRHLGMDINTDLAANYDSLNLTIQLTIEVFAAAIVGIFVFSLCLSKTLTREVSAIAESIDDLARGKKIVELPVVASGKEMSALVNGLYAFKRSLAKIDDQKQELKNKNLKLMAEINERKKTEADLVETRSRLQYLLDHNPTMIYTAVARGDGLEVTYVSENAQKVLGHEAATLLGDRRLWAARLEIDKPQFLVREMCELYQSGGMVRDYGVRNSRGELVWLQDSMALSYSDNGRVEVLGSLTNITAIKEAEAKLHEMNKELEQLASSLEEKVKLRTADLEQANQDLERLSEAKSEFVSIVSHDLRTPLTSIKLFSDIMLDDLDGIDRQSQEEYLSIISAETDRLSRLISNVLDFQKISAGKMQWNDDYVDIVEVIRECVRPFRISIEAKGIEFVADLGSAPIMTLIDGDRLAQVAYNLLSNALKFTEAGHIKVCLKRLDSIDGQRFRLSVSDTGPGMAPAELEKVFEPFEQVRGVPNIGKGTGLGLYITRCVVDRYHGRAWAESEPGQGAVFHIELPIRRADNFVI